MAEDAVADVEVPDAGSWGAGTTGVTGAGLAAYARAQLAATPAVPGLAGGFRLDAEAAGEAVRVLGEVVEDLEVFGLLARRVSVGAAGVDPVSVQLVWNIQTMVGRAASYVQVWTAQIRDTRDVLQAQIDGVVDADRSNAERLS